MILYGIKTDLLHSKLILSTSNVENLDVNFTNLYLGFPNVFKDS